MIDGKVAEDILFVGSQIPMSTADGHPMMGIVKEVKEESVTMDFNHPMAGKTLNFDVTVVDVRETTPEDLSKIMGGGCSCGDCGGGCGESECGDGCNCGGCN
jgi:FKBP-type peptidyl-prolyl cis-trans isomerase SlyD